MRKLNALIPVCLILALSVFGCGSDGDDRPETDDNYDGTWDVRYNLTVDDCQLVTPGIIGLIDQNVILESESGVQFVSVDQLINVDNGEIREDGSLFVNQATPADIFGDGTPCNIDTTITYSNRFEDQAETLLSLKIICVGQVICTSEALGTATRQPE